MPHVKPAVNVATPSSFSTKGHKYVKLISKPTSLFVVEVGIKN